MDASQRMLESEHQAASEDEARSPPRQRCSRALCLGSCALLSFAGAWLAGVTRPGRSGPPAARSMGLRQLFTPTDTGEADLPIVSPYEEHNPFTHPHQSAGDEDALPVLHRGYDCWIPCMGSGACDKFCGVGNACCRKGALNDPPECAHVTDFWTSHHECVQPVVKVKVNHFAQDCWDRCETGGDCAWCGFGHACCRKNSTIDPPECGGVVDWPTDRHHTCVKSVRHVPVKHEGQDCYDFCKGAGLCNWCGHDMACCKYGDIYSPNECRAVVYYSAREHHVCVQPSFEQPVSLPAWKRPEELPDDCPDGYSPGPLGCVLNDGPRLQSFYVYRALDDEENRTSNFNAMSLSGLLYYVHTSVLGCPRANGITRIKRLLVTVKNTQEVYRKYERQFAPLLSFRREQCISPSCLQNFQSGGYAVGCSLLEQGRSSYPPGRNARYSFPGPCPLSAEGAKTEECLEDYPGGLCDQPDGTENCTFHLEDAGYVTLDELSGRNQSLDFADWCAQGFREWEPSTDRGVGMSFWDNLHNGAMGKERMYKLAYLFWKKYPSSPKRLADPCQNPYLAPS